MFKSSPRRIQFYETDLMGIVHHSNYLRIFEEARVAWAIDKGLLDYQKPESASHLAVLETQVKHLQALKFGDVIETEVQVRAERARIIFEYKLFVREKSPRPYSVCRTVHVALDKNLNVMRIPEKMKETVEKEKWTETWL